MIDLMIVAGSGTSALVKHIEETGTMRVKESYESLAHSFKTIKNEIIEVDKLIYVYQDPKLDIGKEMMCLLKLLSGEENVRYMITIKEIVFFHRKNTGRQDGLKYFKHAMKTSNFENFRFYESEDPFAVLDISDYILNENEKLNIRNTYKSVYRHKRNEPVNILYDPENINAEVIEPYTFDNINNYDKAKEKLGTLNNLEYNDSLDPNAINHTFDNPSLPRISSNNVLTNRNIYIHCGLPRSGKTINTAYFVSSAVADGKNVTVINLTNSDDLKEYLRIIEVGHDVYHLKDFMLSEKFGENYNLNILDISYKNVDIRLEGLRHILSNINKIVDDIIVIECPLELLQNAIDCIGFKLDRVFFAIETLEKDIMANFNYINVLSEKVDVILLLSEICRDSIFSSRMSAKSIKSIFTENVRVIAPIDYTDSENDGDLYRDLISI